MVSIIQLRKLNYRHPDWSGGWKKTTSRLSRLFFVAIAEPNTIIKVNGDKNYIASIVAHASNVPGKILETEKVLQGKRAVNVQHQKIGKLILDECCERNSDVRKNTIYVPLIFCLVYGVYRAGNFG
ncbi:hypothetical protein P5G51_013895 [Virgibacillus sp. 179-BFC.A HS]|uniref:Uncharacterized protein n=1 Tax=Tigheibacillus jepli TaxID=3035914 RepID=A0ABU5CJ00_9BACI|nr:hypothetical protein [Virgibacillus sp. 179-BFC.A HS]MDY0406333.1 hypothetical protein [Virgibacillus sp. 179-BFC.A HS]